MGATAPASLISTPVVANLKYTKKSEGVIRIGYAGVSPMPPRNHARSTIMINRGSGCHSFDTKSNPKRQRTDTKSQPKAASSVVTYIYKIKLLVFFGVFVCFYLFF